MMKLSQSYLSNRLFLSPLSSLKRMLSNNVPISFTNPKELKTLTISNIQRLNHNTKVYTIQLESPLHSLGLTTSSFVSVEGAQSGVFRPYTPISSLRQKGSFDLLIKSYPNGNVSKYMNEKKVGETINIKGPFLKLPYEVNMKKYIGMIAGGSGITPMLQVINEIMSNPTDSTQVTLLYANEKEDDILLRQTLVQLAKHTNVKLHFTLTSPDANWKGERGIINEEMLRRLLPFPSNDTLIYVCGPPGFMDAISGNKTPDYQQGQVSGHLKAIGYNEHMVYKF